MSKRLEVLAAVVALIETALPGARVKAMSNEDAKPERVGPLGMAIVRSGDPGVPEVDLSPPTYHYEHDIPVELAAYESTGTSQQATDAMAMRIGAAIAANRFLGGLCDWLDAEAPTDGEADADKPGTKPIGWADFRIVASYSTTSPLG